MRPFLPFGLHRGVGPGAALHRSPLPLLSRDKAPTDSDSFDRPDPTGQTTKTAAKSNPLVGCALNRRSLPVSIHHRPVKVAFSLSARRAAARSRVRALMVAVVGEKETRRRRQYIHYIIVPFRYRQHFDVIQTDESRHQ